MKNIDDDNGCNTSGNKTFQDVLDARVSRRGLISGGLAAAAFSSLGGVDALLRAVPASAHGLRPATPRFSGHPGFGRRHRRGAAGVHRRKC